MVCFYSFSVVIFCFICIFKIELLEIPITIIISGSTVIIIIIIIIIITIVIVFVFVLYLYIPLGIYITTYIIDGNINDTIASTRFRTGSKSNWLERSVRSRKDNIDFPHLVGNFYNVSFNFETKELIKSKYTLHHSKSQDTMLFNRVDFFNTVIILENNNDDDDEYKPVDFLFDKGLLSTTKYSTDEKTESKIEDSTSYADINMLPLMPDDHDDVNTHDSSVTTNINRKYNYNTSKQTIKMMYRGVLTNVSTKEDWQKIFKSKTQQRILES